MFRVVKFILQIFKQPDSDFVELWEKHIKDAVGSQRLKWVEDDETAAFTFKGTVEEDLTGRMVSDLLVECFTEGYVKTTKRTNCAANQKKIMTQHELNFCYGIFPYDML